MGPVFRLTLSVISPFLTYRIAVTTQQRLNRNISQPSGLSEKGIKEMKPWRITLRQGLVLVTFEPGKEITLAMIRDINHQLNSDPKKYRLTNVVYDLRGIVPAKVIDLDKITELVEHMQTRRESWWKHEKTAMVVDSKITYGLSRMYTAMAEGVLEHQVNIFEDDLEAAIEWARSSV